MRTAILLTRRHGESTLEPGPVMEPNAANALYKQMVQKPRDLAEVQMWTSSAGEVKRKRFPAPQTKENAEAEEEAAAPESPATNTPPAEDPAPPDAGSSPEAESSPPPGAGAGKRKPR